jgi:hypothetical protein
MSETGHLKKFKKLQDLTPTITYFFQFFSRAWHHHGNDTPTSPWAKYFGVLDANF